MVANSKNLIVCDNPLVSHNLAAIRHKDTPSEIFRNAVRKVGITVMTRAFENLPVVSKKIQTPLVETEEKVIDDQAQLIISPILRAGLVFSDVALDLLPMATVYHIGLYRDEKTLKPVPYYNNMPKQFPNPGHTYIYLLDPMLATGGSAIAAIKFFTDLNIPQQNITFISLLSAPEGVKKVFSEFPEIKIITAALDQELSSVGYILPGLGDAGDRTFNT